jgi:cytochrome P450
MSLPVYPSRCCGCCACAEFNPDRFGALEGPIPNEVTEEFAYLPFGGGRRKCIGDQFALFEAIVALAVLIRRVDFGHTPDKPASTVGMTTGGAPCRGALGRTTGASKLVLL